MAVLASALALGGCPNPDSTPPVETPLVTLDQGWSDELRQLYYYTTQGSRLTPYDWALALERVDGKGALFGRESLAALGYVHVAGAPKDMNPDGLPIGLVKDTDESGQGWIGFTCAACHSGIINAGGKRILVEGAPPMTDFQGLLTGLAGALDRTAKDDKAFDAFVARLKERGVAADPATLRPQLVAEAARLNDIFTRNRPDLEYGPGRLDAFGYILNAVVAAGLGQPDLSKPSNSPVSYPAIWLAPHLQAVQWNASAANPLERNTGEVMGTFAQLSLGKSPQAPFGTSAHIKNLTALESWVADLNPPAWPADVLGALDEAKRAQGEALFKADCAGCHTAEPYGLTDPAENFFGRQFIRVNLVHKDEVLTDPTFFASLSRWNDTPTQFLKARMGETAPGPIILAGVVRGAVAQAYALAGLPKEEFPAYNGFRFTKGADEQGNPVMKPELPLAAKGSGFKAGPLAGVWATAPYLHNGSVPTLYDLLLPPEQRPATFTLGPQPEFDAKKVGIGGGGPGGAFVFDTKLPGNMNIGHAYPKGRQYTDEERWAVVEYLKSLHAPVPADLKKTR